MCAEPVKVSEIPKPGEFAQPMVFQESPEWFACGRPPVQSQGWKLYVPLTMTNARAVIGSVVPVVQRAGLHFKYVKSIRLLRKLNAGKYGYPQIGKDFVIYLPVPDAEFIAAIQEALAPYRDQCPAVPCANPFADGLPLYYRYGSYRSSALEVGDREVEDNRDDAAVAVPVGVRDLLAPFTKPVVADPVVKSFLLRYPTFKVLSQQGKGGLFLAMNLGSHEFQEVILKVGYHRGQVQPDGSDGCGFLRREIEFYRLIESRGLTDLAPRLVDALDVPRKVILVLEFIPGTSLLSRKLRGELTIEHLERSWAMIARLNAAGLYLGDAKIANFLATDEGDLRAIDFESAGVMGDKPPAIRTFFLSNPELKDSRLADRAHFLASVLYPYEEGRYSWSDRRFDLTSWLDTVPDSDTSAWALDKLGSLLSGS